MNTERPQDPFEQASYDLNKFRERRIADRRFSPRGTADRRAQQQAAPEMDQKQADSGTGMI
jgi:hypothetical protein